MSLRFHLFFPPVNRSRRGFGLLGLSIALAVLSAIAALAVPITKGMVMRARARAVHDDLQVFSTAFQAYAAEHGDWPVGDGAPGAIPSGMLKYLRETNWQRRTPIGGNYAWDASGIHRGAHLRAAIVIAGSQGNLVTTDRIQLAEIDRLFDDAELTTGNFFLGYRNWPVFVLER